MHVSDGARQRSRMMENEASSRRPVKLVNKKRPCATTNPSLPRPLPYASHESSHGRQYLRKRKESVNTSASSLYRPPTPSSHLLWPFQEGNKSWSGCSNASTCTRWWLNILIANYFSNVINKIAIIYIFHIDKIFIQKYSWSLFMVFVRIKFVHVRTLVLLFKSWQKKVNRVVHNLISSHGERERLEKIVD